MKIENIIDDIVNDTLEIKDQLEEKLKKEWPELSFTISLPGLKELTAIKVIELSIMEENYDHKYSVDLHTHNGYRVFEHNPPNGYGEDQRHPLHHTFITLLREIIKKRKSRKASCQRPNSFLV